MKSNEITISPTPIGKDHRARLRREFKRTGMTAIRLMSGARDAPVGLTSSHINRWMSGFLAQAFGDHLDYVLQYLASLPDNAGRTAPDGKELAKRGRPFPTGVTRIAVTEEMSKQLRAELARTNIDHATLLDKIENIPAGLSARIIRGWLYRDVKTTNENHWTSVIEYLRQQPDFTGTLPVSIRKARKTTP